MTECLFFYGTLQDRELRELVAGMPLPGVLPARCVDWAAETVAGAEHPALVRSPGAVTAGVLVSGIPAAARARFDFFEAGGSYALREVTAETAAGPVAALAYVAGPSVTTTGQRWDFAAWAATARPVFVEASREWMAHADRDPAELGPLWPGMQVRAAARLRARAEVPVRRLRRPLGRSDVTELALARPYTQFFAVEEHRVQLRRFDGKVAEPVLRAAFVSADAVTVLPWDPGADLVLLVEQWRAGPWARGDLAPWTIEAVAGRIDPGESPEATARREAAEEAGITLGRLAHVAGYYPSPGAMTEHITSYVGEARLAGAGGLHGLAGEGEDIRAFTLPLAEALAAVESGEIANAPLILTLHWLALNRDRLAADWAGA